MVFGLLERTLGPRGDAEDVMQEVFLRVYARAHTLQQPSALRSFVYSVAIRVLKWELRRRRVRRFLMLSGSGELPEVPSEGVSPEARDLLRRFYAMLEKLSAEERLLFSLRHLEKLAVREVGEALRISPATVKRRLAGVASRVSSLVAADPALQGYLQSKGASYVEPA
jgi:RNA polymerase sigma-70 factor (ECF subfamily)